MTAVKPPSMASIWPVMCLPASLANKTAAPFRSSWSPRRRNGAPAAILSAPTASIMRRQIRWKESRCDRVDGNTVAAPIAGQRTREVHYRALAGVIGDHLNVAPAAPEARRHRSQAARRRATRRCPTESWHGSRNTRISEKRFLGRQNARFIFIAEQYLLEIGRCPARDNRPSRILSGSRPSATIPRPL
jgi:hypothetical protein